MYDIISDLSDKLGDKVIAYRRDFHQHAEIGWLEMRTSAIVAQKLTDLGYEVLTGRAVCKESARMGLPNQDEMKEHYKFIKGNECNLNVTDDMQNGFTGVIGIMDNGEGPELALRFDIDALGITEEESCSHQPVKCGFVSENKGFMHACGHDGHTAIGLGTAEVLMNIRNSIKGKVKLIFQPAEEGVRGAAAVVENGHLDSSDFVIGAHISDRDSGETADLCPGISGALATTKFDVDYWGESSHAGGAPEKGRNAIMSAATAILNLYAIPRNSLGSTRINVGKIIGGTGRNVIADNAHMEIEVRGETTELCQYMEDYAVRIIKSAAEMQGTEYEIKNMGKAFSMHNNQELIDRIKLMCSQNLPCIKLTDYDTKDLGGSEDFSYMVKKVQEHGGQGIFMRLMTDVTSKAHNKSFDFDEKVLINGVKIFSSLTYDILKK